jgi:hypothetical protein
MAPLAWAHAEAFSEGDGEVGQIVGSPNLGKL